MWATYLVAYGVRITHICVEVVTRDLPAPHQEITYVVAQIVFLLFAALVVRKASCWAWRSSKFGQSSAALAR